MGDQIVQQLQGHFFVVEGIDANGTARILEAELGPLQLPCSELITHDNGETELLLLERKRDSKQSRFSWAWYLPYLREHRRALIEVGITSFVANLLKLVPPLALMVLINQVVASRSIGALLSISAVMVLASLVEAVLKTLREYTHQKNAVWGVTARNREP